MANQQQKHERRVGHAQELGRLPIHILRHGMAACLFTTDAPENWPAGHRYMRDDQPRHKVTCEGCLGAARKGGF